MPRFNHRAIWAMVVLQQVLGFVWYSPPLFLNLWLEGIGKKQSGLNQSDPVPFIAAVVAGDWRGYGQGTRRRRPHGRHPGGLEKVVPPFNLSPPRTA